MTRLSLSVTQPFHLDFELFPTPQMEVSISDTVPLPQSAGDGRQGVLKSQELLEDYLKFENLLAGLSIHFINLSPDQVDADIQNAQRSVCLSLNLDASAIWQFPNVETGTIQLTHLYHKPVNRLAKVECSAGDPPAQDKTIFQMPETTSGFVLLGIDQHFPWIGEEVRNNQTVIIRSIDELPEAAALDKEFLRHYGTKSSVIVPLTDGGMVLGAITFAMLREERDWPSLLLRRLQVLACIFAHALSRKKMDETLRESQEQLTLAAELAHIGLWDLYLECGEIRATTKTRELFGMAPGDGLSIETLLDMIHPDDVARFRQTILSPTQSGEYARTDFRIQRPDGSLRGFTFLGRFHAKKIGHPIRMMGVAIDVTEQKRMEEELQARLQEITELKKQIEMENLYLKEEFKFLDEHSQMVGQSEEMKNVFQKIEQVAPTDSHVLITGETGTGKELVARAIHAASARKDRIMVKVNCAALSPTLIESELFGREKGAFTGALARQIGRFELADGGTIFLDEIGELSVELQSKLLRVLQEGEFERLGGPKTIRVNVRVIAATNQNLVDAVSKGEFRKDLYYRLSVFPIEVPPLRSHPDDIPLLAWAFINQFGQRMGKKISSISQKTIERLKSYSWPGNIRELRNTIEHAMILSQGTRLEVQLPEEARLADTTLFPLKEAERRLITEALKKAKGRIKGPEGAAALLGLNPSTLYSKMKILDIQFRGFRGC